MTDYRMRNNRRDEARYYFDSGSRIKWRCSGYRTRRRRAWLNEMSHSGISFFVESDRRPDIGTDIEVNKQADGDSTLCKVVRVTPLDGNMTLVGCRTDDGATTQSPEGPRRGLSASREADVAGEPSARSM